MDDFMTSAEVARLLGVGPTSVKRWADSGLLPCLRTPGRHRRFSRAEVERFRMRQHEAQSPDPAQVDAWIRLVESECGPYEVHGALLFDRSRMGSWWQTADLVGTVLVELGARWERGQISVLGEHLASERLARGLARCAEAIALPGGGPKVLLAPAEGDEHTLGVQLAELCFREAGWNALVPGRPVPVQELTSRLEPGDVQAIALSASAYQQDTASLTEQVRTLGRACAERDAHLLVGGSGAWPESSPDLPRFHRVSSFRELHELLEVLEE
jgi:MerR family transcriptional regulator, light-induced transcriptional regulator